MHSLQRFLKGFIEFRRTRFPELAATFERLADGQEPDLLFVACSDSRLVPNMLSGADPGEMFVVRTVGNLVAPAAATGISVGDVSEASAIEYAVDILKVSSILVCGHSGCGAMKALLDGRHALTSTPNLVEWLGHGEPAVARLAESTWVDATLSAADRLSQVNVLQQMAHVRSYKTVQRAEAEGRLHVEGAWFDIRTADLHYFDPETARFVILDEAEAQRRLITEPS